MAAPHFHYVKSGKSFRRWWFTAKHTDALSIKTHTPSTESTNLTSPTYDLKGKISEKVL